MFDKKFIKPITIIWFVFILIFFTLSFFHYKISLIKMPQFKISKRPYKGKGSIKTGGSNLDAPLKNFINDFNLYINEQNKLNKSLNIAAFIGYLVAGLIAMISLCQSFSKKYFFKDSFSKSKNYFTNKTYTYNTKTFLKLKIKNKNTNKTYKIDNPTNGP